MKKIRSDISTAYPWKEFDQTLTLHIHGKSIACPFKGFCQEIISTVFTYGRTLSTVKHRVDGKTCLSGDKSPLIWRKEFVDRKSGSTEAFRDGAILSGVKQELCRRKDSLLGAKDSLTGRKVFVRRQILCRQERVCRGEKNYEDRKTFSMENSLILSKVCLQGRACTLSVKGNFSLINKHSVTMERIYPEVSTLCQ